MATDRRLHLATRGPNHADGVLAHLVGTAVPGVEEHRDGRYRRTLRLTGGPAILAVRQAAGGYDVELHLAAADDGDEAVARCRHLLDLDVDGGAADIALARDPVLAPLVRAHPGRRVPRTVDGAELAVRAVLGQQVSTAAARTHAARLVVAHGRPVADPNGGLTHLFPTAAAVAGADVAAMAFPHRRRATLVAVANALAAGTLDLSPGAPAGDARTALLAIDGIGPWTAELVAMRALGDPDAFLPTDLGVKLAAVRLGLPSSPAALVAHAERWRPWRAYAVQHLWSVLDHPIATLTAALRATGA